MARRNFLTMPLSIFCAISSYAAHSANAPRTWEPAHKASLDAALIRQTDNSVVLATAQGRQVTLPISDLSDEDLRYIKNMREAVRPFRSWTFTDGSGTQTFNGAFVKTIGLDTPLSKVFAVMIHDDGRKRGYPVANFSAADRAYIAQQSGAAAAPVSYDATPGDEYKVRWTDFDPVRDKDVMNYHATKHFLFIWGNQIEDPARNWSNPEFRQMNFDYFEKIWDFNQDVQHAPLPYAKDAQKFKTPVYITGTGLRGHKEGFAYGGISIDVHPAAMLAGSSVLPHEFTHTLQLHMGGYRGPLNQAVGWFWECHANWNACQFVPSVALALEVYNDRMHYELSSTRDNYGSWPFLEYIAEHPRFDPSFNFDVWTQNKRNGEDAIETPFQTMMRLGSAEGKFTGDGVQGFGDLIGEVAAHNVTWDYTYQWTYKDLIGAYQHNVNDTSRDRVILQPVADRAGWYRPIYSQSPKQYGINIIDLVPAPGAKKVSVDLNGIVDEVERSNWRATLVAIDKQGRARYGRMWRSGTGTIELKPGETRLALAIAGAPDQYTVTGFRTGFNSVAHYPYEVSFHGCAPSAVPDYVRPRSSVAGAAHPNGGGFVAASAHADPGVYIAPGAMVLDNASVTGNARIEDHAVVEGQAKISGNAIVGGYAVVRNRAQVSDNARVRGFATVENEVKAGGNACILEYIRVHGNGSVGGDALIKGFGDLYVGRSAPIGGGAIVGENVEAHADNWGKPIDYGLLYEFMAEDQLAGDLKDNHHEYAHWDFETPRKNILKDALADNDGILRAGPAFVKDDGRGVLSLNGKQQYAIVEGSSADTVGLTIDTKIKWRGGAAGQDVIAFGASAASLAITPKDETGHAAFTIRKGGVVQTVRADRAIPVDKWTRLTVTLGSGTAVLYIDGKEAGRASNITIRPCDLRAEAGYIGSGIGGHNGFNGELDDIAVYRTAFPDFASIPSAS